MALEDEINSSNFTGEDHKLAINLLRTGSWYEALTNKHFSKFGISTAQHNVLRILRGAHPSLLNVGTVQARMVDKSSNVTRLAFKLREKGYIVQTDNANNRRIQELRITKLGLEFLAEVEKEQHHVLSHLARLSQEEMQQLNVLLDKIRS